MSKLKSDDLYRRMLEWRGIDPDLDDVCPDCGGSGIKTYGNTATWLGGIGGQMLTDAVCDNCWGSGKLNRKGVDLRKLRSEMEALKREKI